MKHILTILVVSVMVLSFTSCDEKENTTTLSTVAKITDFSFAANDSIPGLKEAIFIVDQLTDTGIIRMRKNDSVRFGTPITAVVPKISYYSTPSSVTFYIGDTAIALTGYDTLDLTQRPIKIHVIAQDTKYDKWYKLDFNVHTMNGDLFLWDQLTSHITHQTTGTQKAFAQKNTFFFFQNDEFRPRMFISNDLGVTWEEKTVSGLPTNVNMHTLVEGQKMFFYAEGNKIYYSGNGYTWDNIETSIHILALYMCFNNRIWMAGQDAQGVTRFYTMDTDLIPIGVSSIDLGGDTLPADFPVSDFATIPFTSSSLHQHALIAGGYDRYGNITDGRWSLEYNSIYDSYHMNNMASEKHDFPAFAGSSISYYGKFLYLLGGVWEDRTFLSNVYTSTDEGMNWTLANDSANSKKPSEYTGRLHTSTFELDGNIYIIGGEDHSTTYSDVYRGRMNSIDWPEIGN